MNPNMVTSIYPNSGYCSRGMEEAGFRWRVPDGHTVLVEREARNSEEAHMKRTGYSLLW